MCITGLWSYKITLSWVYEVTRLQDYTFKRLQGLKVTFCYSQSYLTLNGHLSACQPVPIISLLFAAWYHIFWTTIWVAIFWSTTQTHFFPSSYGQNRFKGFFLLFNPKEEGKVDACCGSKYSDMEKVLILPRTHFVYNWNFHETTSQNFCKIKPSHQR